MRNYGIIIILILTTSIFKPSYTGSSNFTFEYTMVEDANNKQSLLNYHKFTHSLAVRESSDNYLAYNKYGYTGKYQFGKAAMHDVGIYVNATVFLNDPYLQEYAMLNYLRLNEKRLGVLIEQYKGKTIKNIKITKSGLLAGAHLGGSNGVKRFLLSGGKIDRKDANGTMISHYIRAFSDFTFDLETIEINKLTFKP